MLTGECRDKTTLFFDPLSFISSMGFVINSKLTGSTSFTHNSS